MKTIAKIYFVATISIIPLNLFCMQPTSSNNQQEKLSKIKADTLLGDLSTLESLISQFGETSFDNALSIIKTILSNDQFLAKRNIERIKDRLEHIKSLLEKKDTTKEYTINIAGNPITAPLSQLIEFIVSPLIEKT